MFVQQSYQSKRTYALKTLGKLGELALDSSYSKSLVSGVFLFFAETTLKQGNHHREADRFEDSHPAPVLGLCKLSFLVDSPVFCRVVTFCVADF